MSCRLHTRASRRAAGQATRTRARIVDVASRQKQKAASCRLPVRAACGGGHSDDDDAPAVATARLTAASQILVRLLSVVYSSDAARIWRCLVCGVAWMRLLVDSSGIHFYLSIVSMMCSSISRHSHYINSQMVCVEK